jgi:hypothetical protein
MASLTTPPATLSFPNLITPKAPAEGAAPKYSCVLLFSPAAQASKEYAELKRMINDAGAAFFKDKWQQEKFRKTLWNPIRDAGEKDYSGFQDGWTFISAGSKSPVPLHVRVGGQIYPSESPDTDFYPGALVRALVGVYAYDNVSKGVALGLNSLLLLDGNRPRIDGRPDAKKAFRAYADEDEDLSAYGVESDVKEDDDDDDGGDEGGGSIRPW